DYYYVTFANTGEGINCFGIEHGAPGLVLRPMKKMMGTVVVTSVGMAGRINGWVIPVGIHPLCFGVGSIVRKPGVVEDRIEPREILYLTVLADHDVIDGAPAVRALAELTRMIESGYGLQNTPTSPEL
ncbi:MAG: 2-oxo acid dehydrogenase subunit E2, partial [Thermoplasmatota archaeon]